MFTVSKQCSQTVQSTVLVSIASFSVNDNSVDSFLLFKSDQGYKLWTHKGMAALGLRTFIFLKGQLKDCTEYGGEREDNMQQRAAGGTEPEAMVVKMQPL